MPVLMKGSDPKKSETRASMCTGRKGVPERESGPPPNA
jgi:hypothetical protein